MKRTIQSIVSLAVAGFILWWLFRDINWTLFWDALRQASLFWVLASQIPVLVSFFTRIIRWGYIVRAAQPASFRHMFSATQIGFMANFILPLRAGEVIRPLVLARLTGIPFAKGLALTALDRVTDIFGLLAVMTVAVLSLHFGGWTAQLAERMGGPAAVGASILAICVPIAVIPALVLLYLKQDAVVGIARKIIGLISTKLAERLCGLLRQFAEGMHIFRSRADMAKAVFFSLITWGCYVLSTVMLIFAFHIDCPWYTVFVVQTAVAIAISAPSTPGFIGVFEVSVVLPLRLLGNNVSEEEANALALVSHILTMLALVSCGIFCLFWEKLSFVELTKNSKHIKEPEATQVELGSQESEVRSQNVQSLGSAEKGTEHKLPPRL